MELALDLAKSREGHTGSNPSVGCVIVKNDKIISIGQTSLNGRPHAEYNAIINSHEKVNGIKNVCNFRTMLSLWQNISLYFSNH